jgi:glycosyltransferase involved in cell wall biosynthesis
MTIGSVNSKQRPADIAVWGRVPPPIGGMAVHLQRILPHLERAGISVQMYSVGRDTPAHPAVRQVSGKRVAWFLNLLFRRCESLHYVFSDNTRARFAASLLSTLKRARVVLRIGGEPLAWAARSHNPINRFMARFAIQNADVVIGVTDEICRIARSLGARRVMHIPGFIPASDESSPVPEAVASFLNHVNGRVLLASGEIGDNSEDDLYGAYLLLDLIERMPEVHLIFYAYMITKDERNQEFIINEIHRRGLTKRFLLFRSTTELLPVMRRCDLLIRPTLSDGDSNSIREALHLGLPVVASNCVARPEGVVLFQSGNLASLEKTVAYVLENLPVLKEKIRSLPKANNAETTVALFQELLNRRPFSMQ